MRGPSKNGRVINWGCVLPLLAYLAVAGGTVAGAIYLDRHSVRLVPPAGTKLSVMPGNNLLAELARCQALGNHAKDDHTCLEAWMENRRRFFGGNPEPASSSKPERMSLP
jgi:conjugative transfer region protein TrbK